MWQEYRLHTHHVFSIHDGNGLRMRQPKASAVTFSRANLSIKTQGCAGIFLLFHRKSPISVKHDPRFLRPTRRLRLRASGHSMNSARRPTRKWPEMPHPHPPPGQMQHGQARGGLQGGGHRAAAHGIAPSNECVRFQKRCVRFQKRVRSSSETTALIFPQRRRRRRRAARAFRPLVAHFAG